MSFDIKKTEEKILEFWKNNRVFEKLIEAKKKSKPFIFFEGPPTANARPGIHHFLGRAIKDLFIRYKTMRGFDVSRKAGWDTHGLPVEIEIEKELGLKNKKEIEEYGIAKFNAKAKENVWKYKDEWEKLTKRMGFWLDMKDPYITYDKDYIETLWYIIKKISDKKLLYEGHKVLPWCPRCGTALSSHEVAQGYENITENSVYVKFKLTKQSAERLALSPKSPVGLGPLLGDKLFILAWTTTPWTLPGNVALAVNKGISYSAVLVDGIDELLIVATDLIEKVFAGHTVKYLRTFKGDSIIGLEYEPLFNVSALKSKNSYKIYPADFVTTNEGTGVVHTAVMYGEDDYNLGQKIGLPKHHTVDESGKFTKDVNEFAGKFVKDAEPEIISYLKNKNLLFKTEPYAHDYPFCWRCKAPLLYYANDSWFVAMSKLKKKLLANNKKINWIPSHLKDGRFGEFLKDIKDWAFSRERYWGTPLPIWKCEKCKKDMVIGSYEEIHKNSYHKRNTFYFVRHGFSTKNEDNITSSRLENDKYHLTERGIEESKEAAKKLKKWGGADVIVSSPFLRTKETAEIIAGILGVKVQIDPRLHELDHGSMCEGHIGLACLKDGLPSDLNFKFGDGESWMDVRKRMMEAFLDLNKKHEGKKILIVGHGDPLTILEAMVDRRSDKELLAVLRGQSGKYGKPEPVKIQKEYIKKGELRKLDFKYGPYDEFGYLNPHRPYIDEIFLKCKKCGGKMTRVKEVADVWFDSGAMPFAQWHYPFSIEGNSASSGENEKEFKKNFPADFITEGIDQTRGWFYSLLAVSTLLGKEAPYKNVVSYSHVLDEKGKKMSKSLGNTVNPWDVIEKFGADAARWYFYTVNNPGDSKLFSEKDVGAKFFGFMTTLWNSLRFFELYHDENTELLTHPVPKTALDRWIYSKINNLIKLSSERMDAYDLTSASRAIENFVVEDLSNWWIRRSRNRFQKSNGEREKSEALSILRHLLLEVSKIIAPFIPFTAEEIHLRLHKGKAPGTLSVHLHDWPRVKREFIDDSLENGMDQLRKIVALGLAQRKEKNIKVRQPLHSIKIKTGINKDLVIYLKEEVNVKNVIYDPDQKEEVLLDTELTQDLIIEGYVRELIRKIQDMRKEAGYKFEQKVLCRWHSEDSDIKEVMNIFGEEIKSATLTDLFEEHPSGKEKFDIEIEFELAPNRKISLGLHA